ncbi:MAG: trypsin-like serine protease [Bdellovibrionales bacterium]|nr:trypsin-like serine protease [Bdellovibrionales bacterium]
MKALLLRCLLMASLLTVIGCGVEIFKEETKDDGHSTVEIPAGKTVDQIKVECSDLNNCPSYVGQLVLKKSSKSAFLCTATLIAPNQIATNAHCLSDYMTDSECRSKIRIVFPKTRENKSEVQSCNRIIGRSFEYKVEGVQRIDYAVIELKSSSKRKPIVQNRDGMSEGYYQIAKVMPSESFSVPSRVVVDQCEAVMKSVVVPKYQSHENPIVFFPNCKLVHGNSGSAIIDSSGEMRGVVSAGKIDDPEYQSLYEALRRIYQKRSSPLARKMQNLPAYAIGTNLHCTEVQGWSSQSSDCKSKSSDKVEAASIFDKDQVTNELAGKAINWVETNSDLFLWTLQSESQQDKVRLIPTPLCLLSRKYRKRDTSWVSENTYSSDVPVWTLEFDIDEKARLENRVQKEIPYTLEASFSGASLNIMSFGGVSVTMKYSHAPDYFGDIEPPFLMGTVKVPMCDDDVSPKSYAESLRNSL